MELAWHTQKNQMNDVKGKEMEQERKGKISNTDIDLDKTKNNYDLVEDERTLYQRVKNRVEELKENGSRVQKNSVVMYSNILTVSEEQAYLWGEEKTDNYFKACYEFFSKEFGIENVVSAKIHKDETSPHMHLHFVPVNKENGKLQARVSMNKAKINYIHDQLPKFLQERGFDVVRGKGKTEKNIEDIHEFKELKKLERQVKADTERKISEVQANARKELAELERENKRKIAEEVGKTNDKLTQLKAVVTNVSSVYQLSEKLEVIENKSERSMFGKRMLKEEVFQEIKDIILSVKKESVLNSVDKQNALNKLESLEEKNRNLSVRLHREETENHSLQLKQEELQEKIGKSENDIRVYEDILIHDFKVKDISNSEYDARLILSKLERDITPEDEYECEEWLEVLTETKNTSISADRLNKAILLLKELLSQLMEVSKKMFKYY